MVKAIPSSMVHDTETDKSQNHHSHSTNGDRNDCDNTVIDVFRWSRCKKPLPQKVMRSVGIPLPIEHVEVLLVSLHNFEKFKEMVAFCQTNYPSFHNFFIFVGCLHVHAPFGHFPTYIWCSYGTDPLSKIANS